MKSTLSDEALKNIWFFGVKKFELSERSEFLNFNQKDVYFSLRRCRSRIFGFCLSPNGKRKGLNIFII